VSERKRGWKFDKPGLQSFSKQEERILFLRAIPAYRMQALTALFDLTFISFIRFVLHRFRKFLPTPTFSDDPSRDEFFRFVWNIPKKEGSGSRGRCQREIVAM
jgi:hypothetical protein